MKRAAAVRMAEDASAAEYVRFLNERAVENAEMIPVPYGCSGAHMCSR